MVGSLKEDAGDSLADHGGRGDERCQRLIQRWGHAMLQQLFAVGLCYENFAQTSDEEVHDLVRRAAEAQTGAADR